MSKLRHSVRELSNRARRGDAEAACDLLRHSVKMGHRRLALRRMALAHFLGARDLDAETLYCAEVARSLPLTEMRRIVREAGRLAQIYSAKGKNRHA